MPNGNGRGPRSGSQGPRDGRGKGTGLGRRVTSNKGTGRKTGGRKGNC